MSLPNQISGLVPDSDINQRIRWVVLVQKSSKGPFTTAEVESLLNQGVIQRNNIAYQTLEGQAKAHTGWKFLWQFAEFERRSKEGGEKPKPHEPQEECKTTPKVAPSTHELPPEVADIKMEDLVFGSKREISHSARVESFEEPPKKRPFGWVVGVTGVCGFLILFYAMRGSDPGKKGSLTPSSERTPSSIPPRTKPVHENSTANKNSSAPVVEATRSVPPPPARREELPTNHSSTYEDSRRLDDYRAATSKEDEEPMPIIQRNKGRRPIVIDEESEEEVPPASDEEE